MDGKWTNRREIEDWYQKSRDVDFKKLQGYDLFLLELHCEILYGAVQMVESNMNRVIDEKLLDSLDKISQNVITEIDTFYEYLQFVINDVIQGE